MDINDARETTWRGYWHSNPTNSLWHPCEEAQASCDVQGDKRHSLDVGNPVRQTLGRCLPVVRCSHARKTAPARTGAPRPLVSELPTGMAWGASRTSRSSCTQILGCLFGAICLGLSWPLWSGRLCSIAHGLGQHLAQLGFGLLRCADRSRLDHVMAHKTAYGDAEV